MKQKLKVLRLYKRFQPFVTKGLFILALSLFVFTVVKAASRSVYYNPGETLDPTCAPGETNCSVYPALNIAISKTYAELSAMVTASQLVSGRSIASLISAHTMRFTIPYLLSIILGLQKFSLSQLLRQVHYQT